MVVYTLCLTSIMVYRVDNSVIPSSIFLCSSQVSFSSEMKTNNEDFDSFLLSAI